MTTAPFRPERIELAPGFDVSRIVTGLWQVADQERDGRTLDRDAAAEALAAYAEAGFDAFDMADHYGSAEEIAGLAQQRLLERRRPAPRLLTKWVPAPGPMAAGTVRDGLQRSFDRLGVGTIDLMQLHWWDFRHPGYLDALAEMARMREEGRFRALGLTNFDTDHLRIVVGQGLRVATNQVSFSLLDRRAREAMSAFCLENGVGLLAYGTLGGGFLTERFLGAEEPASSDISDWSKMKYGRFIREIGGWGALQGLLAALKEVAGKHGVSVANVATRWVLEQPAVKAVVVGARLTERDHRADNLRVFSFSLDGEDRARIEAALARVKRLHGDCGDEYRRPPFLTASGDLRHHLDALPPVYAAVGDEGRRRIDSGSVWEEACGFSRAVQVGNRILVSGTTATHGAGEPVCPDDIAGQTVYILDKISAAISSLGGSLDDVVRTRIYIADAELWEPVARVHGRYVGSVRPANTLVEVSRLVGDYLVEIEAEAVVG
jgi:aryl-alcohol dehydrogenase-like predicted oxidoreductase/enamine deaminase RidA (YjgF/YER057c/UK114 family)